MFNVAYSGGPEKTTAPSDLVTRGRARWSVGDLIGVFDANAGIANIGADLECCTAFAQVALEAASFVMVDAER